MFPEAKPKETLRVEGKQNSLFPEGPVIKCFVIPPNSKYNNTRMSAYDFSPFAVHLEKYAKYTFIYANS